MHSINLTVLIVALMGVLAVGAAGTDVVPSAAVMADMTELAGLPR